MNPKLYGKVFGIVLLLVACVGYFDRHFLGMDLRLRHTAVHLLTGAILAGLGFGGSESLTKNVVLIFGVVYTILGVIGFMMTDVLPMLPIYRPDVLTNVIHLAVGLLALAAATMGGKAAQPAAAG